MLFACEWSSFPKKALQKLPKPGIISLLNEICNVSLYIYGKFTLFIAGFRASAICRITIPQEKPGHTESVFSARRPTELDCEMKVTGKKPPPPLFLTISFYGSFRSKEARKNGPQPGNLRRDYPSPGRETVRCTRDPAQTENGRPAASNVILLLQHRPRPVKLQLYYYTTV